MRRLAPPAVDDSGVFDEIVIAKQQPTKRRLSRCRSTVTSAYATYAAAAPDVELIPRSSLPRSQVAALLHAYTSSTKPFRGLYAALLNESVAECPYCGGGEASTLDHFLPKETFPEFAILSLNLVPSCARCNGLKGEHILATSGSGRRFTHPYFDDLPAGQFLAVDVELRSRDLKLDYKVVNPGGAHAAAMSRIEEHFKALHLRNRYRVMALNHLRGRLGALRLAYQSSSATVAQRLQEDAQSFAAGYGHNDWRAVLYSALAHHHDFCDGGFEVIGS